MKKHSPGFSAWKNIHHNKKRHPENRQERCGRATCFAITSAFRKLVTKLRALTVIVEDTVSLQRNYSTLLRCEYLQLQNGRNEETLRNARSWC